MRPEKLFVSIWWVIALMGAVVFDSGALAAPGHWVGAWACGPQLTEPANLPPTPMQDRTLRQFVHTTVGGTRLRVRFSNAYGTSSVTINAAHVALALGTGSSSNGVIATNTDKALSFHGAPSANIPPGEVIYSDPFAFNLPPLTNLAISIFFGVMSTNTINGHPGSRTTSYLMPGNFVSSGSLPEASPVGHWYIITGVDVLANSGTKAIVALGDSITDGLGSTTNQNNRWPDDLAARLNTNAPTASVAVLNQGIGGNGIFSGTGPSAEARFDRDVVNQSGARWLIVFEGVNDIGTATDANSPAMATNIINAYQLFIAKAHARGMLAYGATITPFQGNSYYDSAHESARETVNNWIRTSGQFDGVLDFDAVVRDPAAPTQLYPPYNSGDGLHPSAAGYQAIANSINLSLFAQ